MGAVAWFGLNQWRETVMTRQTARALAGVEDLMAAERWAEASGAIRAFGRNFGDQLTPAEQKIWRELDIETSERLADLSRLVWLESRFPELVHTREMASLLITRTFAAAGQSEEADRIREGWRGREERPELWLALDVDRRLAADQPIEARGLLESVTFTGTADTGRQLRLAMLAPTTLEAWEALNRAASTDPRNPDVRSFRAQILERLGAVEAARVEYVAALVANPEDSVRRDQLAQFYLRHGGTAQALQTWRDGLTPTAPDFLWLRVLLWQRLYGGDATAVPAPPRGGWMALIEALRELPPDRFWSATAIDDPLQSRRAAERPEVELLRLLEHLRDGREDEALIEAGALDAATAGLDPVGVTALQAVLRWRATELVPSWGYLPTELPGQEEHVLIEQLRQWPGQGLPPETEAVLRGPAAWPALLLAAGWPQGALIMAGEGIQKPVTEVPAWYHYGLASALRQNRGGAAAAVYLAAAPAEPVLQLLAAEIAWTGGEPAAKEQLARWAAQADDIGYRSAWLLAMDALDREEGTAAQAWIEGNPALARSLIGREMLARVAVLLNQPDRVAEIYTELGPRSLEAGMYLARLAFQAGDWARARELTEELLAAFPEQIELRRNLESIAAAEAAASGVATP